MKFNWLWLWSWLGRSRARRIETINAPVVPPTPEPARAPAKPAPAVPPKFPAPKVIAIITQKEPKSSSFDPSPNFKSSGDKARTVSLVIIHATEGSFNSALNWLTNGRRPNPTSAHYLLSKKGQLIQLVGENDIAWHAGSGTWEGKGNINARSIGIELENKNDGKDPYPAAQLEVLMWLSVRIARRHGALSPKRYLGHVDVDPTRKSDPGKLFPWEQYRASLAFHLMPMPKGDTA